MTWNGAGTDPFTRTYTYETLNRLSGLSDSTNGNGCPGLSWSYDAWGNRTAQTITAGGCRAWSQAYNGSNQITGYTYDAAGNVTSDGSYTYYYDAEGRIIQVGGTLGTCSTAIWCYYYDPMGNRIRQVQGGTAFDMILDLQHNVVSEYNTGGVGWSKGYVYLGNQLLAEYGDGTTYFVQGDHQGSARVLTKPDQTIADAMDYLPFGEQLAGYTVTTHKFTGYDRDYVTGNDYARARFYGYRAGSFLTPDPAGTSATCLFNPQTQNRYVYVTDNPLNETDPTGLCGDGDNSDCGGIGISIPFFPGGGGAPPAAPTPLPIFGGFNPVSLLQAASCQAQYDECVHQANDALGSCVRFTAKVGGFCLLGCGFLCPLQPEACLPCIVMCARAAGVIAATCIARYAVERTYCFVRFRLLCREE